MAEVKHFWNSRDFSSKEDRETLRKKGPCFYCGSSQQLVGQEGEVQHLTEIPRGMLAQEHKGIAVKPSNARFK